MSLRRWWDRAHGVTGAPSVRGLGVTAEEWLQAARDVAAAGGRLLSLWASVDASNPAAAAVYAALLTEAGVLVLELATPAHGERAVYAGLAEIFPAATRMQRAAFDLSGVRSSDPDQRPWLRHSAWPADAHPLLPAAAAAAAVAGPPSADAAYEFVRVEGEGVHEIAVGPVHAGTIEPGHFRFSVVGEKVLRLEQHLGYVHKGIERRFTELPILAGHRLAARVSGDSAVAFSWAYCQALEGMSECLIPARAAWLRALFLELERIANHLGDLGALGNDAGFAFGLAQFSRLKEELLRAVDEAFGQRYLLDAVVPGGTQVDVSAPAAHALTERVSAIAQEANALRRIYDEHSGVRDRFAGAGCLAPELAVRLGVLGLVARASGQALDARCDLPCAPYSELAPAKVVRTEGDVAARVAVRFDELQESCRLVGRILASLPGGPHLSSVAAPAAGAFGVGFVEGWRGPVFLALEAGAGGSIHRCHPHDPSWQNWPALEHAVIGNIVPDFPLINKSFNLSYSGPDV
ncbi:MAG: Ni,Fe-hydrogenase III large subunit [Gammaproteobacteria bacterium]|nr:MAG: Ni,Fe-hydrogenase III large subunit [Gammaproteobacteria bacterium]